MQVLLGRHSNFYDLETGIHVIILPGHMAGEEARHRGAHWPLGVQGGAVGLEEAERKTP